MHAIQRSMSLLEEENSQLKETIQRQGYSLSTLENEKQDLVNDVEVAKTTVSPACVVWYIYMYIIHICVIIDH